MTLRNAGFTRVFRMSNQRCRLVELEAQPYNAEAPLQALAELITPTPLFYIRNHFDQPSIDPSRWRLTVDGWVEHPREVSLDEVQRLPERTVLVTMECAGNGRALMAPAPTGTPWAYGAVSTARFTGTPLCLLLDDVRLRQGVTEVIFVGADHGEVAPGRTVPFARSLPVAAACHPDTLLAWAMNGEPLTREHGFPLRLVVPRWYGVASVKWLTRISAQTEPFEGHFQTERYVYMSERRIPDGMPVTLMRVRSIIARPTDGAHLRFEPVEVAGAAWSGMGSISRVDLSVDGGHSWTAAELGTSPSPYAATPWRLLWTPLKPGTYPLLARATDSTGNSQPLEPIWNTHGYGNNVAHRIRVIVG